MERKTNTEPYIPPTQQPGYDPSNHPNMTAEDYDQFAPHGRFQYHPNSSVDPDDGWNDAVHMVGNERTRNTEPDVSSAATDEVEYFLRPGNTRPGPEQLYREAIEQGLIIED